MNADGKELRQTGRWRYPGARPFEDSAEDQEVFRGREGDVPYTIEDALESRRQAAQLGRDLQAAIELRVLARRLAAYRDRPE